MDDRLLFYLRASIDQACLQSSNSSLITPNQQIFDVSIGTKTGPDQIRGKKHHAAKKAMTPSKQPAALNWCRHATHKADKERKVIKSRLN